MIGIDVTHQAVVPVAKTDELADLGNHTGRVFAGLFRFFAEWHAKRYGWDGSPIHDAVAVGHVATGDLVETRPYRVDIETTSELTLGRTVVDREGLSGRAGERGRRAGDRPGPFRRPHLRRGGAVPVSAQRATAGRA